MGVTTDWREIRCASLRVDDLRVLADLRGRAEIRVLIRDDRAWVCWQGAGEITAEILPGRILPLAGVELFTERAGRWYRLGEHLPALRVPFGTGDDGAHLDRLLIPGKLSAQRAASEMGDPLQLGVVVDEGQKVRLASAFACSLKVIAAWADEATSFDLSRLRGAWIQRAGGDEADAEAEVEAVVFVLGEPGRLPHLAPSVRYWGSDLLVPLGFRVDPDLPASTIRGAVGAGEGDLVVIDDLGIELIDREAFEPLSRAGIRLADGGRPESISTGGRAQ